MIQLVIDSLSDLLPDEAKALRMTLLALPVRFGGEEFHEGVDLSREEFFRRLRSCTELPKTSQIDPDTYRHTFRKLLSDTDTRILYLAGSSRLSGCFQSACLAREMLGADAARVHIFDTLTAISGCAQMVWEAARMRDQGMTMEAMIAALEDLQAHQRTFGQAEDLKYLVMGGRLNPLVAQAGGALGIKPMLKFEEGAVEKAGLVRGRDKALAWYADRLREHPPRLDIPMWIAGADCPAAVEHTRDFLASLEMRLPEIKTMGAGSVVGTYAGPGLVALSWIEREEA